MEEKNTSSSTEPVRLIVSLFFLLFSVITSFGQSPIGKGKALYESRKYPEAEKVFRTISEKASEYPAAQYYLGRIAFDRKNYNDAADFFKEATERNPKEGDYFSSLGDAYAAIGSESNVFKQMSVGPKALRAWEKATELDAKNISARVSLVGAYLQAPGFMGGGEDKAKAKATEALALLDDALIITPANYLYLYWYGKTSAMTGLKLDQGEECLKKYLSYTPKKDEPPIAGAYMRLGQIKEKKGNKAEAKKYFEIALAQDKNLKGAKDGLERTSK